MEAEETLLARARRVMAGDRYAVEATGIDIDEVNEERVKCRLKVDGRHCNVRGVVMGGALFTLADFAAAVLVNLGDIEAGTPFSWVTASSEVHFVAAATGDSLVASVSYLKRGRKLSVMQTMIEDDSGRLVAIVNTTSMKI